MRLDNFSPFGPKKYYGHIALILASLYFFLKFLLGDISIPFEIIEDFSLVLALGYLFAWMYHKDEQ